MTNVRKYIPKPGTRPTNTNCHLTLRIRITKRMKASTARRLVHRAMRDGIVPEGIDIHWIDWTTQQSGTAKSRSALVGASIDALRHVYHVFNARGSTTRFAKVAAE